MFFHALTFENCLNKRLQAECSNHLPRDPANVNAMKQTRVITILVLPDFSLKQH